MMEVAADLSSLTADAFEACRGDDFALQAGGGEVLLRLSGVRRLGPAKRAGGAFSLEFMSPPGPFLPQAIYSLAHPSLGRLDIFLVPLGPRQEGNLYEAIFA